MRHVLSTTSLVGLPPFLTFTPCSTGGRFRRALNNLLHTQPTISQNTWHFKRPTYAVHHLSLKTSVSGTMIETTVRNGPEWRSNKRRMYNDRMKNRRSGEKKTTEREIVRMTKCLGRHAISRDGEFLSPCMRFLNSATRRRPTHRGREKRQSSW